MRKNVFYVLFILLFINAGSQEKKNFTEAKEFVLDIADNYKEYLTIPFKQIIVKDFRFDTTKLGYLNYHGMYRIRTNENPSVAITKTINEYFQNNLDKTSDKTLIIIIKSFWFQQQAFDLVANDKIVPKDAGEKDRTGICFTDFELFSLSKDGYQALLKFKYDFVDYKYDKKSISNFFYAPFDSLFEKIHSTNIDLILSHKRNLTWNLIDSNYKNRFILPILTNDIVERGVFLTFEDFKNKRVTYQDFKVKKSKITDELYVKNNDKEEILPDFWGYCDGKDYYIRVGYNFFRLYRQNNTFDILGGKYLNRVNSKFFAPNLQGVISSYDQPSAWRKTKLELRPLQLNMDSGLTY